jgi:hypothetical protein
MVMRINAKQNIPGTDAGLKTESNSGKSSEYEVRMPLVLADIWSHVKSIRPALCENTNRNHMRVSQQAACLRCTDAPGTVV